VYCAASVFSLLQPYSKIKFELEFNLGEILPVNMQVYQLNLTKLKLEYLKFSF